MARVALMVALAAAVDLEVWSPAPGSTHAGRDVDLGFRAGLPDTLDVGACELCVMIGGETLACEPLEVLATEQLQMTDLLPGRRELRLVLYLRDGATGARTTLADASSTFTVGADPSRCVSLLS